MTLSGCDAKRLVMSVPRPNRVLVIVTRRIGDVLLATPLIRSLRRGYPHASIDALVFEGTQGILAKNPDLNNIITVAERPAAIQHQLLALRIARRYDMALSLLVGDRPTMYAWLAGRWRMGLVAEERKQRWKRRLLQRWVEFDDLNTHTVLMNLAIARALGIEPCYDVVAAWNEQDRNELARHLQSHQNGSYAVLHPYPKFAYKMWHASGWIEAARWLQAQGLRVVLSGSDDSEEAAHVAAIARDVKGAINLTGKLSLSQAACLVGHARLYAGPDTALTHMAAAQGVPAIALYGPTNPVKWGPWPAGYASAANPWRRHGSQRVNNVFLIQGQAACAPCLENGCDRHRASYSDCLQQLPSQKVIAAMSEALAMVPRAAYAR